MTGTALTAQQSPMHIKETERITTIIDTFLQTGVCILEADYTKKEVHVTNTSYLRAFIRALAREQKRPFIYAHCIKYHPWKHLLTGISVRNRDVTHQTPIQLTIPYTKALSQIYAGLVLVAPEVPSHEASTLTFQYANGTRDKHLWRCSSKTTLTFYFGGPAVKLFENFVERCRTDKVWRIILKIPHSPKSNPSR